MSTALQQFLMVDKAVQSSSGVFIPWLNHIHSVERRRIQRYQLVSVCNFVYVFPRDK